MSGFIPVSAEQTVGDVVNLDLLTGVPETLLQRDCNEWLQALSRTTSPGEQKLAQFLLDRAVESLTLGQFIHHAHDHESYPPDFSAMLASLSAKYALSRLMGRLIVPGIQATDASQAYRRSTGENFLLDYTPQHNALSVIANKSRLDSTPFEGEAMDLEGDGQWYASDADGIYVHATSPAVASDMLMDDLTIATGSPDGALRAIDADNSVNLRSYISLGRMATLLD